MLEYTIFALIFIYRLKKAFVILEDYALMEVERALHMPYRNNIENVHRNIELGRTRQQIVR